MTPISAMLCAALALAPAAFAGGDSARIVLMNEDFEHGGAFPPPGWAVGSQAPGPDWSLAGNSSNYKTRADGRYSEDPMDERLISPAIDCTGYTGGLVLKWWTIYQTMPVSTSYGYIEVSTDDGSSWATLKTYSTANVAMNPDTVMVPQAANEAQVRFRWRYVAPDPLYRYYWELDNLRLEATVSHDVGVDSLMGPSSNDKVRAGAQVRIWARVCNFTSDDETGVPVTCTSDPAGYSSSTTVALLPANGLTMVSFPTLWTVPASGTFSLTAATTLAGDGDPANNATTATGITPVSFPATAPLLLSWQDATERDQYQAALAANSVAYDSWSRTSGNLYGLEAWDTVIFAEQAAHYPTVAGQIALMRYLDEGDAVRGAKYLLLSGNQIGYFYHFDVIKDEFFRTYLHALCDGSEVSPTGNQTYYAAPCAYIGTSGDTDQIRVSQTLDDEIGADAEAETLYAWQWEPTPFPVAIQYASPAREHVFLGFQLDELRFNGERDALLGRILAWFSGPPPPTGMGAVAISASGANVTLAWGTDASWVCPTFRVYRGTTGTFLPGVVYQEVAASPFVDIGAAGNPAVNHFYRVAPVDFGVEGIPSTAVGEFDLALP
ncbi:hypothetical protein JXA88_19445 [Candidatus Fermentibacteria bacterium]|nr:hypothetical protein [Candidatus Fermentibacteria bacterium]